MFYERFLFYYIHGDVRNSVPLLSMVKSEYDLIKPVVN